MTWGILLPYLLVTISTLVFYWKSIHLQMCLLAKTFLRICTWLNYFNYGESEISLFLLNCTTQVSVSYFFKFSSASMLLIYDIIIYLLSNLRINWTWLTCRSGKACCTPLPFCTPSCRRDASSAPWAGIFPTSSTRPTWQQPCSSYRITWMISISRR